MLVVETYLIDPPETGRAEKIYMFLSGSLNQHKKGGGKMQKLKHEPAYYETTSLNGDSVSVLVSVIMLVILLTFLPIHIFSFITQTARDLQPALLDLCSL